MTDTSRPTFLATCSAARLSAQSPTETMRVARIGVGNRSSILPKNMLSVPGIVVGAISDLDLERLKAAQTAVAAKGGKAEANPEFRKLPDRKSIDAVIIAKGIYQAGFQLRHDSNRNAKVDV